MAFSEYMNFKKATKFDKISTVDLHLLHNFKFSVKIFSIFVAFLENGYFIWVRGAQSFEMDFSQMHAFRMPTPSATI